jgi:hypothetical protein
MRAVAFAAAFHLAVGRRKYEDKNPKSVDKSRLPRPIIPTKSIIISHLAIRSHAMAFAAKIGHDLGISS